MTSDCLIERIAGDGPVRLALGPLRGRLVNARPGVVEPCRKPGLGLPTARLLTQTVCIQDFSGQVLQLGADEVD
jgi:hypothetical protein